MHFTAILLGEYEKFITAYFGYDKVLADEYRCGSCETAIKLSRKWGYEVKGIAEDKAKIIVCAGNFHGRTHQCYFFQHRSYC